MTMTPYPTTGRLLPPVTPPTAAASRLLLWLPLPAVVAMAALQVHSFVVLTDGAPDLDPLYGLAAMFILAVAVGIAVVDLAIAAVLSWGSATARAGGSLGASIWTALAGLGSVAYMSYGLATDPMLTGSSTAGDQIPFDVAAGAVAVAPLVVVLVVRSLRR